MAHKNRVLVLMAHPALQKSRVNAQMAAALRGVSGLTFRDLYEEYPDLCIDVPAEQELLLQHDIVIFQHPFYWYSTPAILKEWFDLVLEYGFAYGEGGDRLRGKAWINALTAGGPEDAYSSKGYNRYTIRDLLNPIDQTAYLCGMHFLPPFCVHGTLRLDPRTEIPKVAQEYRELIEALRDTNLKWEDIARWNSIRDRVAELRGDR